MSNPRRARKSSIRNHAAKQAGEGGIATAWPDALFFLAIFVFALTLRLTYLFQIESIPLFYNLPGDPRTYDDWAQRIAAGDWLGQGVFYQAPLYPYFLALLQAVLGHDLWSIRVVQIVLGATACGLLFWVGRSLFSRGAGIAAGIILSLYAPALFFDGLIEKTILDLFLITLLLLLLTRSQLKPHWALWVAIGAVLGLLGLSRENALILAVVVLVWVWLYFSQHQPRVRLGWIGFFLLGLMLVLFPVGLRNQMAGGEFTLTTSQLGPNFFIGNNPVADGTYASLRLGHGEPQFERKEATRLAEQVLGRRLTPGEVSSYWLRRSWDYIRSQPLDWLRLMGKKWLIVWNVREIEDSDDFYLYQRWSWLLRVLGWTNHFGLLAPLAAIGCVLTWRQWRRLWLWYAMLMALAFSIALFYIFGRYRFSMVPLLALFAGAGLAELFVLFKRQRVRELLGCAAVSVLVAAVVNWPVIGRPGPSAAGYNNLSKALVEQGRIAEAMDSLQKALLAQPGYGVSHYNLGNLYASQGNPGEAERHLREAVRIYPRFAEAHNNLGNVLAVQGDLRGAIQQFQEALELNSTLGPAHLNLANALVRQGHLEEAIKHYEHALKIRPKSAEIYQRMGIVLAAQGHLDKAIEHFRQALRIQPQSADAHESLGRALAQQGKRTEAMQHYQEALRILRSRGEGKIPR